MEKGKPAPGWSTGDDPQWRTAGELFQAGHYERLAELLHKAQVAIERRGDTIPVHVLVLARRICLACSQSHAEADWHRHACEEAVQREGKLRHQLTILLDLVGDQEPSVEAGEWDGMPQASPAVLGPPAPDLPEPGEPLSLWQRIQGILRWRPGAQPPGGAASEVRVQGPAPTTIGGDQVDVLPPAKAAETALRPPAEEPPTQLPSPVQGTMADSSPPGQEDQVDTVAPAEIEKQREQRSPSLVVYCLGQFRVYQDDHLITDWESLKAKGILKYLVAHYGTPIVKDVLMDVFWPDAEPEAARRNLHQAVYSLRKTLRQRQPDFPYVWFEDDCYLLNPDTSVWLDFEQFKQHCQEGLHLERAGQPAEALEKYGIAEGLYQGDFLEEDLYEDWPTPQRQHLRTLYVRMADSLSEYYLQHGDPAASIVLCRKILSLDSCWEEAHRRLMACYLAQGQRHLAVRQYQACVQALREELDLAPSEETASLYHHIVTGV